MNWFIVETLFRQRVNPFTKVELSRYIYRVFPHFQYSTRYILNAQSLSHWSSLYLRISDIPLLYTVAHFVLYRPTVTHMAVWKLLWEYQYFTTLCTTLLGRWARPVIRYYRQRYNAFPQRNINRLVNLKGVPIATERWMAERTWDLDSQKVYSSLYYGTVFLYSPRVCIL